MLRIIDDKSDGADLFTLLRMCADEFNLRNYDVEKLEGKDFYHIRFHNLFVYLMVDSYIPEDKISKELYSMKLLYSKGFETGQESVRCVIRESLGLGGCYEPK